MGGGREGGWVTSYTLTGERSSSKLDLSHSTGGGKRSRIIIIGENELVASREDLDQEHIDITR